MAEQDSADAKDFELATVVEHVPSMIWTARPEGPLDYVNSRVLSYFGRTFAQMIDWGWVEVVHPDDLAKCGELWSLSLETGKPYEIEFRLRQASDGAYRLHLARAVPLHDASGRILRWMGVCIDIHDVKPGS